MKARQAIGWSALAAAVALGACMMAGCFTSATAWTESVGADGTKSRSKVSIIGTGDKASQVAASGLFADGGDKGDLGAGVREASATQQSTGIDGTLRGIGEVLGGVAGLVRATQGGGGESAAGGAAGGKESPDADDADGASASYVPLSGYNGTAGVGGEGVYGRTTCSRCQAYAKAHPGVEIIDIDIPANRTSMWAALKARGFTGGGVQLPVEVTADGYTQRAR